jgi:hypothetical protein
VRRVDRGGLFTGVFPFSRAGCAGLEKKMGEKKMRNWMVLRDIHFQHILCSPSGACLKAGTILLRRPACR